MWWCLLMTWRNSKRYWVELINSYRSCKKLIRTFYLERRILIALVAAKWMITLIMFNQSLARTAYYIKKAERPEQLVISVKIWNMRIHLVKMAGLLHKQCHPKSLHVATVNAAAAMSSLLAKPRLKAAFWKVKEWWANLTITSTSQFPRTVTLSLKAASTERTKDKRSWPGPTTSQACKASMIVFIITPSMEPWTKRLRGWPRWRNRRSFSTKECLRRNKEAFRLVSKCLTESKRIIMLVIWNRQAAHKPAKQCWELGQWLERCRPKANTRPDCPEACGLSVI